MKCLKPFIFSLIVLSNIGLCEIVSEAQSSVSLEDELRNLQVEFRKMQDKLIRLEQRVAAQDEKISESEAAKADYQKRITELETQVAEKSESLPPAQPVAVVRNPAAKWNPDIGVVADTVFKAGGPKEDVDDANRLQLRELELVFGSAIDPYSRLDATIAFSDSEEPGLEEAYVTAFDLPLETTGRLGKFKPKVGKAMPAHRDSLEAVDEPLVIQRYFGVEGFNKTGVDLSKDLNFSWPVAQQLTFGILEGGNGEEGAAFGEEKRRPTVFTHLKNYIDLDEETGFEWGLTHMAGSSDDDERLEVEVLGSDLTLTKHFNATQSLKLQSEVFHLDRRETEDFDPTLWGTYGLADLRFHPRWSTGLRYDHVELIENPVVNPEAADRALSGYLTFYQSELARWRLQFTHSDFATGEDDNQVMLQGTFAIGEHKHKLQ